MSPAPVYEKIISDGVSQGFSSAEILKAIDDNTHHTMNGIQLDEMLKYIEQKVKEVSKMKKLSHYFDLTIEDGVKSGLDAYDIAYLVDEKTLGRMTNDQFAQLQNDIQELIDG